MKKHIRFLAALLALAVAFVMLSSSVYITANANHDCIGEGCRICYNISVFENALKGLCALVSLAAIAIGPANRPCPIIDPLSNFFHARTLITLKVKLSN